MKPFLRRRCDHLRVELSVLLSAGLVLSACQEWPRWASPPASATPPKVVPAPSPRPVDAGANTKSSPCGGPGKPLCPLEAWMEAELSGPLQSRDWQHLARSFPKLAAHAPQGYPRWREWSEAGLPGIRGRDVEAVRAACKGCHDAYREDYRRRMPNRAAPAGESPVSGEPAEAVWGRIKPR